MAHKRKSNSLLQTLIGMSGQGKVITVHKPLVLFLDSLEAAMMLGQLLYWTPRSSMRGWIAKSDREFQDELCLKRYSIRSASKLLSKRNLIETKTKKFNKAPTKHYKVNMGNLEKQWIAFLRLSENEQSDYSKTNNLGLSVNEQSLTEITREYLPRKNGEAFRIWKDTPEKYHPFFEIMIDETKNPEPKGQKTLDEWVKQFEEQLDHFGEWLTPKRVRDAIREFARQKGSTAKIVRPKSIMHILLEIYERNKKPAPIQSRIKYDNAGRPYEE
jgi:hypothetical protein